MFILAEIAHSEKATRINVKFCSFLAHRFEMIVCTHLPDISINIKYCEALYAAFKTLLKEVGILHLVHLPLDQT